MAGHHVALEGQTLENFSVDLPKERERRQYEQYGEREVTQGKSLKNALEPARRNDCRLILAGGAALGSEAAQWLGQPGAVSAGLAILAILACGVSVYQKGGRAMRAVGFNIYALISIAVTGACLLGHL